jgi:streptogramin lyase
VIDTDTETSVQVQVAGSDPFDVAVLDGEPYVLDQEGQILRVDVDTGTSEVVSSGGYLWPMSIGIAAEPGGTLAVSAWGGVVRVDPETGLQEWLADMEYPYGLTAEPDGSLLVADLSVGGIVRLLPDGSQEVLSQGGDVVIDVTRVEQRRRRRCGLLGVETLLPLVLVYSMRTKGFAGRRRWPTDPGAGRTPLNP